MSDNIFDADTEGLDMNDGKVALITAGGSGMGADAARRLSDDGFRVAILSSVSA